MGDGALSPCWKLKHFLDSLSRPPQVQSLVPGAGWIVLGERVLNLKSGRGPMDRISAPLWWQVACLESSGLCFLAWKTVIKDAEPGQPGDGSVLLEGSG